MLWKKVVSLGIASVILLTGCTSNEKKQDGKKATSEKKEVASIHSIAKDDTSTKIKKEDVKPRYQLDWESTTPEEKRLTYLLYGICEGEIDLEKIYIPKGFGKVIDQDYFFDLLENKQLNLVAADGFLERLIDIKNNEYPKHGKYLKPIESNHLFYGGYSDKNQEFLIKYFFREDMAFDIPSDMNVRVFVSDNELTDYTVVEKDYNVVEDDDKSTKSSYNRYKLPIGPAYFKLKIKDVETGDTLVDKYIYQYAIDRAYGQRHKEEGLEFDKSQTKPYEYELDKLGRYDSLDKFILFQNTEPAIKWRKR